MFFILLIFCENTNFCIGTSIRKIICFDKNDVFKYWVIQQLVQEHGGHDFLSKKISYLLITWKTKRFVEIEDLLNIPDKKYIKDKNSSLHDCHITFNSENRLLSQDCVLRGSFDKLFENKIVESLFRVDANETKRRFRRKTLNPAMFSSSSYRWADPDDID